MMPSWCHQMCMNGKVNQGPLFDINVWCNRSLKTTLHPMKVRQYSHLKNNHVLRFCGDALYTLQTRVTSRDFYLSYCALYAVLTSLVVRLTNRIEQARNVIHPTSSNMHLLLLSCSVTDINMRQTWRETHVNGKYECLDFIELFDFLQIRINIL